MGRRPGNGMYVRLLKNRLQVRLSEMLKTCVDLPEIYLAQGYWAQSAQDVMRWTGRFKMPGINGDFSLGCWDGVTDCVRRGFLIEDMRGKPRKYAHFEVNANEPKKAPSDG